MKNLLETEILARLTYNAKKRKLVLRDKGIVVWWYKFKGTKPSNVERIFAYVMANAGHVITMAELSDKAGLIPSHQRVRKQGKHFQIKPKRLQMLITSAITASTTKSRKSSDVVGCRLTSHGNFLTCIIIGLCLGDKLHLIHCQLSGL